MTRDGIFFLKLIDYNHNLCCTFGPLSVRTDSDKQILKLLSYIKQKVILKKFKYKDK